MVVLSSSERTQTWSAAEGVVWVCCQTSRMTAIAYCHLQWDRPLAYPSTLWNGWEQIVVPKNITVQPYKVWQFCRRVLFKSWLSSNIISWYKFGLLLLLCPMFNTSILIWHTVICTVCLSIGDCIFIMLLHFQHFRSRNIGLILTLLNGWTWYLVSHLLVLCSTAVWSIIAEQMWGVNPQNQGLVLFRKWFWGVQK